MAARVVGFVNSAINGVKAIPQVTNKVVDIVGKTAQKQCTSRPQSRVTFRLATSIAFPFGLLRLPKPCVQVWGTCQEHCSRS
jgi:hypothetical protein